MAQIRGQLPELSIGQRPRRHAGVSNPVLQVVKQLTIAHALDGGAAQVRWPRILAASDLGLAAAVVGMADLALLGVYRMPRLDLCTSRADIERIFHRSEIGRYRVMQQPLRDVRFKRRRILASARAFPHDEGVETQEQNGDHSDARRREFQGSFGCHCRALDIYRLILGKRPESTYRTEPSPFA